MTTHAPARHRASAPVKTPLTPIALILGDELRPAGRRGAVIAASSGLVATLAVPGVPVAPASAATSESGPHTASLSVDQIASIAQADLTTQPLVLGTDLAQPLTAPTTASLPLEPGRLSATPSTGRHAAAPAVDAAAIRDVAQRASRSTTRSALTTATTAATTAAKSATTAAKSATTTAARSATTAKAAATTTASAGASVPAAARGSAVLAIAARYVGVAYVFGGDDPSGFDCSGYVQYVYKQLGISLPRIADDQRRATRQIPRSEARPGDLVSFMSGGYAYHIGIYAGDGMMYDAPRTGKSISLRQIWSSAVVFTRVTS